MNPLQTWNPFMAPCGVKYTLLSETCKSFCNAALPPIPALSHLWTPIPRVHSRDTLGAVDLLSSWGNLKEHRNYSLFNRNLGIALNPAPSQVIGSMQLMGPDPAEREGFPQSFHKVVTLLFFSHFLVPPTLFIQGTKETDEKLLMVFF